MYTRYSASIKKFVTLLKYTSFRLITVVLDKKISVHQKCKDTNLITSIILQTNFITFWKMPTNEKGTWKALGVM